MLIFYLIPHIKLVRKKKKKMLKSHWATPWPEKIVNIRHYSVWEPRGDSNQNIRNQHACYQSKEIIHPTKDASIKPQNHKEIRTQSHREKLTISILNFANLKRRVFNFGFFSVKPNILIIIIFSFRFDCDFSQIWQLHHRSDSLLGSKKIALSV